MTPADDNSNISDRDLKLLVQRVLSQAMSQTNQSAHEGLSEIGSQHAELARLSRFGKGLSKAFDLLEERLNAAPGEVHLRAFELLARAVKMRANREREDMGKRMGIGSPSYALLASNAIGGLDGLIASRRNDIELRRKLEKLKTPPQTPAPAAPVINVQGDVGYLNTGSGQTTSGSVAVTMAENERASPQRPVRRLFWWVGSAVGFLAGVATIWEVWGSQICAWLKALLPEAN